MRSRKKNPYRIDLSLPASVGDAFLNEFRTLLPELALSEGRKGQYLAEEVFSKYCDSSTTPAPVRRAAAIQKWKRAELQNAKTNQRLLLDEPQFRWVAYPRLLRDIRSLISRILGPLAYPEVISFGLHTNGASTRIKRSPAASVLKLTGEAHVSSSAIKHWLRFASGTRLARQTLLPHEHSSLFTVPKKSDIDRVACKEPEINMVLQRSVGNHIRRRLRKFGINLNDQTINRDLARDAVRLGLATVDLSSASDSITRQLAICLLPFEWWSLLDDLRVHSTVIDGEVHELEMFSSMGNGFTFELESLLFYAITRVVAEISGNRGRISVYGDDIIVPASVVPRLSRVFHWFGFRMNPSKTHYRGLFRESCGGHFYGGFDITPFYIRRPVRTLPDLINHLNALLEWDARGWGGFLSELSYRFWSRWSQKVPRILWGGLHPEDPTALVTGHRPRRRLVLRTRDLDIPQAAGLSLWLWKCDVSGDLEREPFDIDPRLEAYAMAEPLESLGEQSPWSPACYLHAGFLGSGNS